MGKNFEWLIDTEFDPPPNSSTHRGPWELIGFWLVTAVIISILFGGWLFSKRQLAQVNEEIRADIQTLLELQQQSFLAGDGDLFFTFFTDDPEWQAAQLHPTNQQVIQAGLTATRVKPNQDRVWVNAVWKEGRETYQRLLFFENRNGRYRQTATDPSYWGKLEQRTTQWGEIHYFEVDEEWLTAITTFVAQLCQQGCDPFTLVLTDDYTETAVSHTIQVPSPRIFAVDTTGQPAKSYWELLEQRVASVMQPVGIRIALPPQKQSHFDYEAAATQFMAENPDIQIELVTLEEIPVQPQLLAQFDGAAFPPTANLIASGVVYDLTPLIETDVEFDQSDFYEQIWQGTWWRDRMWFMPQSATMRVMFYNKTFYQQAALAEPSLRWTWEEMGADLYALRETVTAFDSAFHYTVFLDCGRDVLFAYAYNWQIECQEDATIHCQTDLTPDRIGAALAWKQNLAECALTPLPSQDDQARWNWQAAVRVEDPIYYEHFLQLSSMGVAPFPGSDRFDGITPLWMEGSFITQHSQHPLAVWRWLKFLSYQPPLPSYRLIPARPSVAQQTAYWQTLPRPLNEAMRSAFPFSKPVTIGDDLWFDDEMITAVSTQELTPQQAVQSFPAINWFSTYSLSK